MHHNLEHINQDIKRAKSTNKKILPGGALKGTKGACVGLCVVVGVVLKKVQNVEITDHELELRRINGATK